MALSFNLDNLKALPWKRYMNIGLNVFKDRNNLILLGGLLFVIYAIGWDTIIRPNFDLLKTHQDALTQQQLLLTDKQKKNKDMGQMLASLQSLKTDMLSIPAGNSPTVTVVAEAAKIQQMAQGKIRDPKLPVLPAPHNVRTNVSMTLTTSADNTLDGLSSGTTADAAAAAAAPPPPPPMPAGNAGAPPAGGNTPKPPAAPVEAPPPPISVHVFHYDLKASGTYPALMDLLNQLVLYSTLIQIDKVVLAAQPVDAVAPAPGTAATAATVPDPAKDPDFPVKLDMTVSLTLILYEKSAT